MSNYTIVSDAADKATRGMLDQPIDSSMPVEAIVEKSITAIETLATSGVMPPETERKFATYLLDESTLLQSGLLRQVEIADTWEINSLDIAGRSLMTVREAQEPARVRGVTTGTVQLTHKEVILPFNISQSFIERNIQGATVEELITRLMAIGARHDLEKMVLYGNTLGVADLQANLISGGSETQYIKDDLLASFNGIIATMVQNADTPKYDAAGADLSLSVMAGGLKRLQTRYRRGDNLVALVDPNTALRYMTRLASRSTPLGDQAYAGNVPDRLAGVRMQQVPLLESAPRYVEHATIGTSAHSLEFAPVSDLTLHSQSLSHSSPAAATSQTGYTISESAGTIAKDSGSQGLKICYATGPVVPVISRMNWILGIGRGMTLKSFDNNRARTREFTMSMSIGLGCENAKAGVLIKNLADPLV